MENKFIVYGVRETMKGGYPEDGEGGGLIEFFFTESEAKKRAEQLQMEELKAEVEGKYFDGMTIEDIDFDNDVYTVIAVYTVEAVEVKKEVKDV